MKFWPSAPSSQISFMSATAGGTINYAAQVGQLHLWPTEQTCHRLLMNI